MSPLRHNGMALPIFRRQPAWTRPQVPICSRKQINADDPMVSLRNSRSPGPLVSIWGQALQIERRVSPSETRRITPSIVVRQSPLSCRSSHPTPNRGRMMAMTIDDVGSGRDARGRATKLPPALRPTDNAPPPALIDGRRDGGPSQCCRQHGSALAAARQRDRVWATRPIACLHRRYREDVP